ncbi:MAG: sigma-54 dependent transcriptional regulator [Acidobacteriota bacterium]|jgi:two-component system, NtrC family, response regulator AtoC
MIKSRILIVDDDRGILSSLRDTLANEFLEISTAEMGSEALLQLGEKHFDVLLTDLRLPDVSGMELVKRVQKDNLPTLCIIMTGHATVDNALEALKTGVFDYITKPFRSAEVRHIVNQAVQRQRLVAENRRLQGELARWTGLTGVIGRARPMQEIFKIVQQIHDLDTTVLITGESGTGKEVLAKAIHHNSRRKDRPFVAVNCGAIPDTLIEDEFFGHVKGAFTDALAPREGVFEQAEGGTLFLDEIGTLRLDLQVKLLRVLQEREFRPIGASTVRKVNVRVIAATNKDLKEMVDSGAFREDLYYRLNIIQLRVPPLSERSEDLLPLTHHFVKQLSRRMGVQPKTFTREALEALLEYSWPGNVRELENMVERALALSQSPDTIDLGDLPAEIREASGGGASVKGDGALPMNFVENLGVDAYLARTERAIILEALERSGWVKSRAARLLKLQRTTLVERLKRLNIPLKKEQGKQ